MSEDTTSQGRFMGGLALALGVLSIIAVGVLLVVAMTSPAVM